MTDPTPTDTRAALIQRATVIRAEIQQFFDDAAHWNSRRTSVEQINPDPDGKLRRIADGIDAMLAKEEAHG